MQSDDILLVGVLGALFLGLVVDTHVALLLLSFSFRLRVVLLLARCLEVHPQVVELLVGVVVLLLLTGY